MFIHGPPVLTKGSELKTEEILFGLIRPQNQNTLNATPSKRTKQPFTSPQTVHQLVQTKRTIAVKNTGKGQMLSPNKKKSFRKSPFAGRRLTKKSPKKLSKGYLKKVTSNKCIQQKSNSFLKDPKGKPKL